MKSMRKIELKFLEQIKSKLERLRDESYHSPLKSMAFALFVVIAGLLSMVIGLILICSILVIMALVPFIIFFFLIAHGVAMLVSLYNRPHSPHQIHPGQARE